MIKPNQLKRGDVIGLVSPSSPLAGLAPHRVEQGIKYFEDVGFRVKIAGNALKVTGYTAGSIEERVSDIHEMFADENVKAIISMIGGFHSNQIIGKLDYKMIAKNPKIFIGFSDITVLHFALYTQASLVTFYGPALMTQFGEKFGVEEYTKKYFEKALMSTEPIGLVEPSKNWTDEFLNWFGKKDIERPRQMKVNGGYIWLKEGSAEGELLGGCITSMMHLRGTKYWPNLINKLFFWEIPESSADVSKGEPLSRVDAYLTDLALSGVFSDICGMIVGRPKGYSDEEIEKLKQLIIERTAGYSFPILFNIDIGHTDPIMTLPIGIRARIDSARNGFGVLESAVV
ncbi:MAG: LD-carboxypeptidase [Patescibacteria group bacterium]|nr:LD-carboxypeptidase [Patescibacteria group bacterium]